MKKILETLLCSEKFLELRRKVSHIVFGVTILCAYFDQWLWSLNQAFLFRLILVIVYMALTNISFKNNKIQRLSNIAKNLFERKDTSFSGIGGLTLLIGCYVSIWLGLDSAYIVMVIVTLSVGDGFATLIGKYLGRYALPISNKRSIFGTLGGLGAALVVSHSMIELDTQLVVACIIGMVVELVLGLLRHRTSSFVARFSIDNLLIPISMILFLT